MKLGVGTSSLLAWSDGLSKRQAVNFLSEAIEYGFEFVDTSPLYSSTDVERFLGGASKKISRLQLGSKFGKQYSSFFFPANRIHQNIWLKGKSDWNGRFGPNNIRKELEGTLKRIKREFLDYYLIHGYELNIDYSEHIHELFRLRELGRIRKIGVSVNQRIQVNLEWCDWVQIRLADLSFYERFVPQNKLMLHSLFTDSSSVVDYENNIRHLKENFCGSLITGTSNSLHLHQFAFSAGIAKGGKK